MKLIPRLQHGFSWFLINLAGLSTALACVTASFIYIGFELTYDTLHSKADRIYRITIDSNDGATSNHPARVHGDWPSQLSTEFPAVEEAVRLVPFRKAIVKIGDHLFFSKNIYATDSSFFKVFDFKIISGNSQNALTKPGRVFITRSMATTYFGNLDVIGKEVILYYQMDSTPKTYVIDGVLEDFPPNVHFHVEMLTSLAPEDRNAWAYTYLLLKKGSNAESLRSSIHQKWKKESTDPAFTSIPYLQKITDIHLFSHKEREMEKNGDIRSILLLGSGALIILLIALMNYMNLNQVQFISNMNSFKVKRIIGASTFRLATHTIKKSLLLSLISFLTGLVIALEIGRMLGSEAFNTISAGSILIIASASILIIALISVIPLLTTRFDSENAKKRRQYAYAVPLIVQITLSIIALIGTIALYRQMNYMHNLHPAARNISMLIIYDNPRETLARYEVFKNELMKNPSIKNVTAAMEEPGGEILDKCTFEMEGIQKMEDQWLNILPIDPNFFRFMNIQPVAGTTDMGMTPSLQWEDNAIKLNNLRKENPPDKNEIEALEKKLGSPLFKYILNECAVKMLGFSNPQDAIGKRFRLNFFIPELMPEGEIAGVVPDFHYTNLYQEERPLVMVPLKMFNYCFIIRMDPLRLRESVATIDKTWQKVNPDFPLEYEFLSDHYQSVYKTEHDQTRVLTLFALISILISSLGIFALTAFTIQRRTKEIGIRKVNGSSILNILMLLNRKFMLWGLIAFVIACPIAWFALNRWLEHFAYRIDLSWWIFLLAGATALLVTLITVSYTSWKAATRNPVEALRYE